MSQTIDWNQGSYVPAGDAAKLPTIQPDTIYWKQETAIKTRKTDQCVLVNKTSPLSAPETFRFAYKAVNNIFAGTGIDPVYMPSTKKGFNVLMQVNDIISVKDEKGLRTDYPISAHLVLKGPQAEFVTGDIALKLIQRLLGMTGSFAGETSEKFVPTRLNELIRGAVSPVNE